MERQTELPASTRCEECPNRLRGAETVRTDCVDEDGHVFRSVSCLDSPQKCAIAK